MNIAPLTPEEEAMIDNLMIEAHQADIEPDMVNHPPHYTNGDIECIDAMRAQTTPEEFRGHMKMCAVKYIWRERSKGGDESLRKAIWYLEQALK